MSGSAVVAILAAVFGVPFLLGWWARGRRDRRRWLIKPATEEQIAYIRALAAQVGARDQAIMVNLALDRGVTRAEGIGTDPPTQATQACQGPGVAREMTAHGAARGLGGGHYSRDTPIRTDRARAVRSPADRHFRGRPGNPTPSGRYTLRVCEHRPGRGWTPGWRPA